MKKNVLFTFIYIFFAQNIDCGYTVEPHKRGGSEEYPQCLFWIKNKKTRYAPANLSFTKNKCGLGVIFARTCFPDEISDRNGHSITRV